MKVCLLLRSLNHYSGDVADFWTPPARLLILSMSLGVIACSTTSSRTYPICSWREPLSPSEVEAFQRNTRHLVETYLGEKDVSVAFSASNRVMAARGKDKDHAELAKAWPRVGCIGEYQGPIRFQEYSVCVKYLERAMTKAGIPPLGKVSDYGEPPKQVFCK